MDKSDFIGKKTLVCGLARSGMAAVKLLLNLGAEVCVQDKQAFGQLTVEQRHFLDESSRMGAYAFIGKNPDDILSGFDQIVISPGIPIDTDFIKRAKAAGVSVIGELELGAAVCGSPIIAITGTNGKTTASTLTGSIMKKYIPGSETLGNIGSAFCDKALEMPPEAWVTLEVSSFQLESVKDFRPKISAVLNLTEDHLNRHYTMENYIAVKERIFENQRQDDILILNYDDPVCRNMAGKAPCPVGFYSYGGRPAHGEYSIYIDNGTVCFGHGAYTRPLWNIDEMRVRFSHITQDAMAAAMAALLAGAPPDTVSWEILNFTGVPHRTEFVCKLNGVDYYNDSKATNTDAAIKALEASVGSVVLIAGGEDKKADFKPWVSLFKNKAKYVILFGDTSAQIAEDCEDTGFISYELVSGLKDAVKLAKSVAAEGDTVLLSPACASHDMFRDYEERGDLFKKYVLDNV